MTQRAYRYRFYPTKEQEQLLRCILGSVRLVYNKALHTRTEVWHERNERVGYSETIWDADDLEEAETQVVSLGNPRS